MAIEDNHTSNQTTPIPAERQDASAQSVNSTPTRTNRDAARLRKRRERARKRQARIEGELVNTIEINGTKQRADMTKAWPIVEALLPYIQSQARHEAKRNGAEHLGSDELEQRMVERIAKAIAKRADIEELYQAAQVVEADSTGSERPPADNEKVRWLYGVVRQSARYERLDELEMDPVESYNEESETSSHSYSWTPRGVYIPGRLDPTPIAQAITDEITRLKLDSLVDTLLELGRDSNDTIHWEQFAERILQSTEDGRRRWKSVSHLKGRELRDAAKGFTVKNLKSLPPLVDSLVAAYREGRYTPPPTNAAMTYTRKDRRRAIRRLSNLLAELTPRQVRF